MIKNYETLMSIPSTLKVNNVEVVQIASDIKCMNLIQAEINFLILETAIIPNNFTQYLSFRQRLKKIEIFRLQNSTYLYFCGKAVTS